MKWRGLTPPRRVAAVKRLSQDSQSGLGMWVLEILEILV